MCAECNVPGEKRYDTVFGETFAMYSHDDMLEFIEPFKVRFQRNNLNPKELFKGKKCLDAGCGNGRGSLFMLMNGAMHVTAYDISRKNVESTQKFAREFGFSNVTVKEGSLEKIPFEDESFDFIWCNGVIMHTERPNQCLQELSRVLKVSGRIWLYIYGSGGVYWRIISLLRGILENININKCIAHLKLFRYPTRYIAEFIDDWYSTYLRTYTHKDLSLRLQELGFERPELLKFGMDYDTSHRINILDIGEEKELMGEGDLRYLLTKVDHRFGNDFLLNEGMYGSDYVYPSIITENIDPLFEEISRVTAGQDWMIIAMAAFIQRELRILLNQTGGFQLQGIVDIFKTLTDNAKVIRDV